MFFSRILVIKMVTKMVSIAVHSQMTLYVKPTMSLQSKTNWTVELQALESTQLSRITLLNFRTVSNTEIQWWGMWKLARDPIRNERHTIVKKTQMQIVRPRNEKNPVVKKTRHMFRAVRYAYGLKINSKERKCVSQKCFCSIK